VSILGSDRDPKNSLDDYAENVKKKFLIEIFSRKMFVNHYDKRNQINEPLSHSFNLKVYPAVKHRHKQCTMHHFYASTSRRSDIIYFYVSHVR
jgi:hypothetical protein